MKYGLLDVDTLKVGNFQADKVMFNGAEIWSNFVFDAVWAGGSYMTGWPTVNEAVYCLDTSGSLHRSLRRNGETLTYLDSGPWVTATPTGFNGDSTYYVSTTLIGYEVYNNWSLKLQNGSDGIPSTNFVTFDPATNTWTGTADDASHHLETSGGLIRMNMADSFPDEYAGNWTSLST